MSSFPIDSKQNDILEALSEKDFLIIKSTPGSGKTTRVPIFLHEHYEKKILILEPRRLAAKLASNFVAQMLGEKLGNTVGHIFKYEKIVSDSTKIIFLTEGTFLRLLSNDKNLSQVDIVVLDEFHERHYYTDVALSYLLKIKETNKHLKIVIMSATIDLTELSNMLGEKANVIELDERKFSLSIKYLPNDTLILRESLEKKVFNAVDEVFSIPGHILIFLPGMFEILRCEEVIRNKFECEIVILHSELVGVSIDESFYDLKKKRIILSTNITESSVTIPGVRVVIDSGLHKVSRLNPVTRLPLVELKKISQSSAIQRANRASREDNGLALRLFSEFDYQGRVYFDTPEINRVDLSEFILTTLNLFNTEVENLKFLSPLKESELNNSREYLNQTGFISNKKTTALAHELSKTPFHPRIAKILSEASKGDESTFFNVVNYLAEMIEPRASFRFVNLVKKYFNYKKDGEKIDLEKIMLSGYVDQLGKLKGQKIIHQNGEIYTISPRLSGQIDPHHELWVILDVDSKNQVMRLLPIEEAWLYDLPFFPIEEVDKVDFNTENLKLSLERQTRIGAIMLSSEKIRAEISSSEVLDHVTRKLIPVFEKKCEENSFKRLMVLEKYSTHKIKNFDFYPWFKHQVQYLISDTSYNIDVIYNIYITELFTYLNQNLAFDLERDLPLFLQLNDKRKVPLNYDAVNGISCESYIQDFYGLTKAPEILQGSEKIKISLQGPHKRPLQVTTDLKSFWSKTYKELVGELKRDYPRHYWPENPIEARPILLLKNVR